LDLKIAQGLVYITKIIVFWDVTPSGLAYGKKCFGLTCCIYLYYKRHPSVSEVGGTSLFQNVGSRLPNCTALLPKRQ